MHFAVETSYESVLIKSGSVSVQSASIQSLIILCQSKIYQGTLNVMQSMTRNGRKVFWILALYQQQHHEEPDFIGWSIC